MLGMVCGSIHGKALGTFKKEMKSIFFIFFIFFTQGVLNSITIETMQKYHPLNPHGSKEWHS